MTAILPNRFTETKFSESFWSNSRGDYVTGLNVLHAKIDQGVVEDQEILTYIRERIDVEQRYGHSLIEMGNRRLKLEGFLRDDGASLRKTFETIKTESVDLGNGHVALANNLRDLVLQPLVKFTTHARESTQQSREDIEARLKLFDKHLLELDKAHATYVSKCNAADQAELEASKLAQEEGKANGGGEITDADRRHEFASQRFTIQELNKFLNRMRREIPSQDVKVPIMGVYNHCCTGSLIAHWIQQNTKARTIEEAEHIGQSLADEGFLRLIGQRGNKFVAIPTNFYQWRDQMFELLDDDDKEEELSQVKKMKQEAEKADAVYMAAVKKADMTRMQLEVGLFSHMELLQRFEYDRINSFKNAFLNFAAIFSNIISITQSVADHLLIFQEALRPSNDVQYIIEQYRTGAFVPMPTLYNNFYHGTGLDQVFGVNIDKHCNFTRKKVPQLVMKCLTRIKKSSADLTNERGKITQKLLKLFDVPTVIGVLRLYFLELPGSLVNSEEYETVKIIYSGVTDDGNDTKNDARISSIRNLLALLSSARFYTLFEVAKNINGLIRETEADDTFMTFIAHRWGPVLLRPPEETAVTMHDKHPQRMMRDMLRMTNQIFEPIRMSREEGNLSRSTTTRPVTGGLGRRRGGPLTRGSREIKGAAIPAALGIIEADESIHHGAPAINVTSDEPTTPPDAGSGVGVGTPSAAPPGAPGGPKGQRHRLGPSANRFVITRGVSAPEMFSEVPAFKKKAAAIAAAAAAANAGEGGDANKEGAGSENLSLLNTSALKQPAGGDKSSRSPLRQSLSVPSTEEQEEEEEEEGKEESPTTATEETAAAATKMAGSEAHDHHHHQGEEQESHIEIVPTRDEDTPTTTVSETSSITVSEVAQEESGDWKAVTGAEFEATGRKLERRRKNRQSALSTQSNGSDKTLDMSELSAESVLQALREEDK
ncbi:hypothetical protein BGX31_011236 [Mortierella sp. GBA43]|nr:hypothetical protein BGX31_011236 [Mortierella sp. GBA43]